MTMILTSVTMVGWADVLDSDRGDFRRRRAVDISSLYSTTHLLYFIPYSTTHSTPLHASFPVSLQKYSH